MPPVASTSPDAGWIGAAVGDVNGDGDDEIVAIGENGLLKGHDPVIASGPVPPRMSQRHLLGGTVLRRSCPTCALLVDTGNFDGSPRRTRSSPSGVDPNNATSRRADLLPAAGILRQPDVVAADRCRSIGVVVDVATGNLDGAGVDELALVNEDLGAAASPPSRRNNVLNPFSSPSDTKPWSDVAIGNVDNELVLPELVAVRNAAPLLCARGLQRYKSPDAFEGCGDANFAVAAWSFWPT